MRLGHILRVQKHRNRLASIALNQPFHSLHHNILLVMRNVRIQRKPLRLVGALVAQLMRTGVVDAHNFRLFTSPPVALDGALLTGDAHSVDTLVDEFDGVRAHHEDDFLDCAQVLLTEFVKNVVVIEEIVGTGAREDALKNVVGETE